MTETVKRIRGKAKPPHERMRRAIGRVLLEALERGETVTDPATGRPAVDAEGKLIRKSPSAAMVKAAMSFVAAEARRTGSLSPEHSEIARIAKEAADEARLKPGASDE